MHVIQGHPTNHVAKTTIRKGDLVSRPAHEMDRVTFALGQTTAERKRLQVDVQAHPLGRVVRPQEPKRLAGTTADVQHRGIGRQGSQAHKPI